MFYLIICKLFFQTVFLNILIFSYLQKPSVVESESSDVSTSTSLSLPRDVTNLHDNDDVTHEDGDKTPVVAMTPQQQVSPQVTPTKSLEPSQIVENTRSRHESCNLFFFMFV